MCTLVNELFTITLYTLFHIIMQKFLSVKYFCGYPWPMKIKPTIFSTQQIIGTIKFVHMYFFKGTWMLWQCIFVYRRLCILCSEYSFRALGEVNKHVWEVSDNYIWHLKCQMTTSLFSAYLLWVFHCSLEQTSISPNAASHNISANVVGGTQKSLSYFSAMLQISWCKKCHCVKIFCGVKLIQPLAKNWANILKNQVHSACPNVFYISCTVVSLIVLV